METVITPWVGTCANFVDRSDPAVVDYLPALVFERTPEHSEPKLPHYARQGLPSRSSFVDRSGPAFASLPPSRFALWRDKLQRYGAASFACIHERRMVDQNIASWNQRVDWLNELHSLRKAYGTSTLHVQGLSHHLE
jgi:hypothetical protein